MKHLLRLYPKAWRRRYGAEITDFLEHRRASLGQIVDLVRGALGAHADPALPERLVFVPELGFRPSGTRVLPARVATTVERTTLAILCAAASAEATELLVEWEPPDESGPDSWVLKVDRSGVHKRPPTELEATLVVRGAAHPALRVEHRLRSASGYDLRALTFPALPGAAAAAELRVRHGASEWRLPFTLDTSSFLGAPAGTAGEHEGVTIRVLAVGREPGSIAVDFEARARSAHTYVSTIGTGGGPTTFRKHLRSGRKPAHPLLLQDDRGAQSEEISRMTRRPPAADAGADGSWPLRVTSVFPWPHADAGSLLLVVPCVVIAEQTPPVTIDLRTLPVDADLGPYRIHIPGTEVSPDSPGRTRIHLELPQIAGSRQLLGPASVHVQGMPADLTQHGVPTARGQMWLDTHLVDEPIVTMKTALVRIDGPWRLPLTP